MFFGLDKVNVHGFEQGYCWVWLRLRLMGLKVWMGLKRECSSQAVVVSHFHYCICYWVSKVPTWRGCEIFISEFMHEIFIGIFFISLSSFKKQKYIFLFDFCYFSNKNTGIVFISESWLLISFTEILLREDNQTTFCFTL